MIANAAFAITLLLSVGSATVAEPDSKDRELWEWLKLQAEKADFDQLPSHRAIYALLAVAKGCYAMEQHELADDYFQ